MCLKIVIKEHTLDKFKDIEPLIAKRDIPVYKLMESDNKSPFNNLRIDRKVESWTKGYEYEELNFDKMKIAEWDAEVNKNSFHSCQKRKDAIEMQKLLGSGIKIVKMHIPKGAKYYKGHWGQCPSVKQYASNKLVWY